MIAKAVLQKTYTCLHVWKRDGISGLRHFLAVKRQTGKGYGYWMAKHEKKKAFAKRQTKDCPYISIIVLAGDATGDIRKRCTDSIAEQNYKNWQLSMTETAEAGVAMAQGEYVLFMYGTDSLQPTALCEIAKKIEECPEADVIYGDEDHLDEEGKRCQPLFKPDWSPDTLMNTMYWGNFVVYKRALLQKIGVCEDPYDRALRTAEMTDHICHIPKILYHQGGAVRQEEAHRREKLVQEAALLRRGLTAEVKRGDGRSNCICYAMQGEPCISIVIPSKDNFPVFRRCVESILEKTTYANFEIIVIDNGSNLDHKLNYENFCQEKGVKYFYIKAPFNFSAMCNSGAEKAGGDYLLFLNDDMELITEDWLERLAGQAQLAHVGAVGAKLYFPESAKIQHSGLVNLTGGPQHLFWGCEENNVYVWEKCTTNANYSAVTGACLMISAKKFHEAGGFAIELPVAYNDVDLCYTLAERGYYNVQRNDVKLFHHESLSRGKDGADRKKFRRFVRERDKLYERHPSFCGKDPFYREENCAVYPF